MGKTTSMRYSIGNESNCYDRTYSLASAKEVVKKLKESLGRGTVINLYRYDNSGISSYVELVYSTVV